MINASPRDGVRVAIIGAGISGLSLAYFLQNKLKDSGLSAQIVIYEGKSHAGGTIETHLQEGFVLESGPDAFITDKPWALELSKKLGLGDELISTENKNRRSFIASGKRLIPVPDGFYLISPVNPAAFLVSPIVSWPAKMRMMSELFIPPKKGDEDETIGDFVRRRFGREALDRVAQAMLGGIYTGDPDRLSLQATMPRFAELEKKYGSVTRGLMASSHNKSSKLTQASGPRYSLFMSFRQGMQTLPSALAAALPEEMIHYKKVVRELQYDTAQKQWQIRLEGQRFESADIVCITSSAKHAKAMLKHSQPELAGDLARIPYESVATINLVYNQKAFTHPLNGFGFVVPKIENKVTIACSFSSQKFAHRAPEGKVLLRAFVGGAFGYHHLEKDNHDLQRVVHEELAAYLGIREKPLFYRTQRYQESMVQYELGHRGLVDTIDKNTSLIPGLFLSGSSYKGVGIPDCIREAEVQADKIFTAIKKQVTVHA